MSASFRIGRIFGIPIALNWSLVVTAVGLTALLAYQAIPLYAPETSDTIRFGAAFGAVVAFFVSVLAHELGHAVLALHNDIRVERISLWILGGVAEMNRRADNAKAEFQVAIAGPVVSLAMAALFGSATIIAHAFGAGLLVLNLLLWLAFINLTLALFNMIPAAPLDGGKVLTAWLWRNGGDAESARITGGRAGLAFAVLLVVVAFVDLFWFRRSMALMLAAVGVYLGFAARGEIAAAVIRQRLTATTAGEVMVGHPQSVPDTTTVAQLDHLEHLAGEPVARPVTRWSPEPLGFVVAGAIMIEESARTYTQVHEVMTTPDQVLRISDESSVLDIIDNWVTNESQIAIVINNSGVMTGTITGDQVRDLLVMPNLWGRTKSNKETDQASLNRPGRGRLSGTAQSLTSNLRVGRDAKLIEMAASRTD